MAIYVILVLFIIFMYPILKKFTKNYKKWYCILCSIFLIIVIGLRNIELGQGDTKNVYKVIFNHFLHFDWQQSMKYINSQDVEIGFYGMMKIYTCFSSNFQAFLFIIGVPYIVAVSTLIYKYSKLPQMSYFLFLALNYFALSFTLLRHVLAMAFLIYAFLALMNGKRVKFIIFVFLASLFHTTALIFFIVYPFSKLKFNLKQIFLLILFLLLIFLFGNNILNFVFSILNDGHYSQYKISSGDNIGFFIINLCLMLFSILYLKKYNIENYKESQFLFNFQFLTLCMSAFILTIGEAFRISTYFGIFGIVLVPNCLCLEKNQRLKIIIYILFLSLLVLYFFLFTSKNMGIYPYRFYWKG